MGLSKIIDQLDSLTPEELMALTLKITEIMSNETHSQAANTISEHVRKVHVFEKRTLEVRGKTINIHQ